jgi:hypothetical protein
MCAGADWLLIIWELSSKATAADGLATQIDHPDGKYLD